MYPGERISWPATTFDGSGGSQLIDLIYYRTTLPAIVISPKIRTRRAEMFGVNSRRRLSARRTCSPIPTPKETCPHGH
jgi:hypothetical protein